MGTTSKFYVKTDPKVKSEDLPQLSKELQDDFWEIFVTILSLDPYGCKGFGNHDLLRELQGCRALEFEEEIDGYIDVYRLVYRITDTPKNKTVEIVSIGLHDSAYDRAHQRIKKR